MQNAKDTFYVVLRDRLAVLNPARTIVMRGVTRPGSLVEENELASASQPPDTFLLRWTGLKVAAQGAMPLIAMQCEVLYSTSGSAGNGGMDRGRLLSAMDAELLAAVNAAPQSVPKNSYVKGSASAMRTSVFWGNVTFSPAMAEGEGLHRTAAIEVFTYQEEGEL